MIRTRRTKKGKKPLYHRVVLAGLTVVLVLAVITAFYVYDAIFRSNTKTAAGELTSIFIPTGAGFEEVKAILYGQDLIANRSSFEWLAHRKNYPGLVKPGHYLVTGGMSNDELVNMLRSGNQTPVRVSFNNIRTKQELAGRISKQLEADSAGLMTLLNEQGFLNGLGVNKETALTLFIPNTYEFWWNTDAEGFIRRMAREHDDFWNNVRKDKAARAGLSIARVVILASIIEKETVKNDEKALIAGVYINRLNKGWPLQADPTVVYASGDFTITRVLKAHTQVDSPYNTYKNKGLPPGPICIPSISSIEAVLEYERHNYMYFCAKADLSGYHVFSRTLREHNKNADAYRKSIARRKKEMKNAG